jgi:hypothetical protein
MADSTAKAQFFLNGPKGGQMKLLKARPASVSNLLITLTHTKPTKKQFITSKKSTIQTCL